MKRPAIATIASALFLCYVLNSVWTLYSLFSPKLCQENGSLLSKSKLKQEKKHNNNNNNNNNNADKCLRPALYRNEKWPPMQIRVYVNDRGKGVENVRYSQEISRVNSVDILTEFDKIVEFQLPERTLKNGSLWTICILTSNNFEGSDPSKAQWYLSQSAKITTFTVPEVEAFNLIEMTVQNPLNETEKSGGGKNQPDTTTSGRIKKPPENTLTVSHLRTVIPFNILTEPLAFDWENLPGEIAALMRLESRNREYLPVFYLNELAFRVKDLQKIDTARPRMNLTVRYRPIGVGKLRLMISALHSLEQLRAMGFGEGDVDEVKAIFADTNFYILSLVVMVSAVHIMLDVLAFKNDIHFWRGRKTMVGLSTRTLLWRCFSQTIVFLYLMESNTSLLVLIPTGIGVLIEYWKIKKAFKVHVLWLNRGLLPRFHFGTQTAAEVETEGFDAQGMKYLAILLAPLCMGWAVYSLLYVPHKSWYGWVIECLSKGVYAFGFLFMLPQLFVNYKLKSVAHLPWRAFMYKAFNTFIDDIFAFVISMPTAHRIACFRDDVVFLVYLYQRYLYPVDRSRVNEFGESFGTDNVISDDGSKAKKE